MKKRAFLEKRALKGDPFPTLTSKFLCFAIDSCRTLKNDRNLDRLVARRVAGGVVVFEDERAAVNRRVARRGDGEGEGCLKGHEVARHPIALRVYMTLRDYLAVPIGEHDRSTRLEIPGAPGFSRDGERGRNRGAGKRRVDRDEVVDAGFLNRRGRGSGRSGVVAARGGGDCLVGR